MAKNDVVVRTAQDLEKKYNFAALLGLKKNVEITAQGIQKIENELNSMLNALVINLKDVLDDQGEVSLWFYSGIPTKENSPYIDWENPNDHIGDIYYDQSSGVVYQWNNIWEVNTQPDLVEAMAITNADTDTSTDHERKVFFETPTIPYSNGDWWIKEDGSLLICQISKSEGTFEDNDFISTDNYTDSIAQKIEDTITVLKGTVTTMTENYAKFTDLATGGSTTIAGENISTGNIQSNNYVQGSTGMKIALSDGQIDSKNLKLLANGDLIIGGYIRTDKGLLTNLQFNTDSFKNQLAYYNGSSYVIDMTNEVVLGVHIPENFEIEEAKITLYHMPTKIYNETTSSYSYGYLRNIKLYKANNNNMYVQGTSYSEFSFPSGVYSEITNAFGSSGWTPAEATASNLKLSTTESIDIKNYLNNSSTNGYITNLLIKGSLPTNDSEMYTKCGFLYAVVDITGYKKTS